jgi:hypothetical protein
MFDFLLTQKPILTLDIQQGEHSNFEPNYELLPIEGNYRYKFTRDNITNILHQALFKDEQAKDREQAVARLFPKDNINASQKLESIIIDILKGIVS